MKSITLYPKKYFQKKRWFTKGGFQVPLFVPHTPRGELARRMRMKEAQNSQGRRIRFRIVEKGGITLEQKLRRSNPWAGEKCGRPKCFPCKSDGGSGGGRGPFIFSRVKSAEFEHFCKCNNCPVSSLSLSQFCSFLYCSFCCCFV